MVRRKLLLFATTTLLLVVVSTVPRGASIQELSAPEYGPAKGTLVIVGGGSTDGTTIMEKFIELGGGPDGKFVIVPTAGGNRNRDGTLIAYTEERSIAPWLRRGVKNVKMLHTHDPAIVVKGDKFEVIGKWKVAVHDNTRLYQPWEKPYYVLGAGDVYNMKTRKIEKLADGTTPAARRGGGGGL